MNLKEDIKPISFIKSNAADVLEQINNTRRPLVVTQNGEARAVLLDPESFDEMKKAIDMLKLISLSEQNIKEGKVDTHDEVKARMKKKYNL